METERQVDEAVNFLEIVSPGTKAELVCSFQKLTSIDVEVNIPARLVALSGRGRLGEKESMYERDVWRWQSSGKRTKGGQEMGKQP